MGCAQSEIAPQNEAPKKGCTDVLWLIIYILFWILMVRLCSLFSVIAQARSTLLKELFIIHNIAFIS